MKTALFAATACAYLVFAPRVAAQEPTLRLKHDVANSELVFTIGPLDLPTGEHHAHAPQPKTQAAIIPVDAYLHGFTTEMVDAQGKTLPSELLHHVNILAPKRRELFSQIMQRIGAAGAETGPVQLPKIIGYRVAAGDSLLFTAMFHNPTGVAHENAQLRIRMKYSSTKSVLPKVAIQPFYVDVMPPAGFHAFTLPSGKSTRSWEGRPAVAGRILGLGGHMHKYGTALRFEDVTTGKVLYEATPAVDASGNVAAIPRKFFWWRLGLKMNPSHTYRLTVEYDNPTGEAIENGAMGTLGGIFVPDDDASWPDVDRAHPEYLADLEVVYPDKASGGAEHHH
jgi:hypothetical protein